MPSTKVYLPKCFANGKRIAGGKRVIKWHGHDDTSEEGPMRHGGHIPNKTWDEMDAEFEAEQEAKREKKRKQQQSEKSKRDDGDNDEYAKQYKNKRRR